MTQRENLLRTIRFERSEYIPMSFHINDSVYFAYDTDDIGELLETHPVIGGIHRLRQDLIERRKQKEERLREGIMPEKRRFFDEFGAEWEEDIDGIRGAVITHPLADFSKIREYTLPPLPVFDPENEKKRVEDAKKNGCFTSAGLPHGIPARSSICIPTGTSALSWMLWRSICSAGAEQSKYIKKHIKRKQSVRTASFSVSVYRISRDPLQSPR